VKTNDKQQIIPESIFAEAACKHFKCNLSDIDIRMITENKEAFIIFQNHGYKVSTRQVFKEDIEFWLTDKNAANHIHFGCWIQAIKNTVQISKVLKSLIKTVSDVEEAKTLLTAVQLASYSTDPDVAFWEILSRIDVTGEILGNAMVVTAQVYNKKVLIDDITNLQILYGLNAYNEMENGIFDTVLVKNRKAVYPAFYIYSADHAFDDDIK